jgi:cell pole-organizing protein PopZ
MAQAAKTQEPSMEEILASIRRIIAEDDPEKPQGAAEPPAVRLNPDAPSSSAEAARTITEPYSKPRAAPRETASTAIGALSGSARLNRSSTIVELSEPLAALRPAAPSLASSPPPPGPIDRAGADQADEAVSVPQTGAAREDESRELMSSTTSAAVDSAFNALAQTVLVHNARTLEDLVREMLRPMLKVWLDDNLPGMVERLVRAEIERVSRGRGG